MINSVNVKPNIETTTSGNVAAVPFKANGEKDVVLINNGRETNSYKNVFLKLYIEKDYSYHGRPALWQESGGRTDGALAQRQSCLCSNGPHMG